MIAEKSMDCAPTPRSPLQLVRFITLSIIITVAITLMLSGPAIGWRQIAIDFVYGLTYTICIGSLAQRQAKLPP